MINIQQLEDRLLKLPNEIYKQELEVLKEREKYEMAKIEYETRFSDALLQAQKSNATEKKSEATINTYEDRKALLKSNLSLERASAFLKAKEAEFTALRRVSNIEETLIKSQLTGN